MREQLPDLYYVYPGETLAEAQARTLAELRGATVTSAPVVADASDDLDWRRRRLRVAATAPGAH